MSKRAYTQFVENLSYGEGKNLENLGFNFLDCGSWEELKKQVNAQLNMYSEVIQKAEKETKLLNDFMNKIIANEH